MSDEPRSGFGQAACPLKRTGRSILRSAIIATLCLAVPMAPVAAQPVDAPAPAPAAPPRPADMEIRGDEITPEQQVAVEKGLAWLASRQSRNGSFGSGAGGYGAHVGITALAGLAFMSNGNLPGRGKYGQNVQRCVDYILSSSQESGLLATDQSHGVMYSHGFATLFLAEVYGMTYDEGVKEKLQKAVRLIQKCQNHEGGWRYQPAPIDADISVTICQVMALRAARDAGIKVEKDVIDKAVSYVRRCQNPDGGFNYTLQGGGSGFARSGAAVATLYYAGIFEDNAIDRGLKYLMNFLPGRNNTDQTMMSHYYYGQYYTVQAMFLAGGEHWARWYPAIRDELITRQNARTGGWSNHVEISEEYSTACALIILQMPNRYLPVFSGKGPGS